MSPTTHEGGTLKTHSTTSLIIGMMLVMVLFGCTSQLQVQTETPTSGLTTAPTDTRVPAVTQTPIGSFMEDMDSYNTVLFSKANGWTNGVPFNAGWRGDHISFSEGIMIITLDDQPCPDGCSAQPYASGEYRSVNFYHYGLYEARLKPAQASGVVGGTFFTYTGPSDDQPWDEIDIEILGKDPTRMQTNYYTGGIGGHVTLIDLGFDSSKDFHKYGFEYREKFINWFVDGKLVHTEDGSKGELPSHKMKVMLNLWPGIGVDEWLGTFSYTIPIHAQVDWVKFTP